MLAISSALKIDSKQAFEQKWKEILDDMEEVKRRKDLAGDPMFKATFEENRKSAIFYDWLRVDKQIPVRQGKKLALNYKKFKEGMMGTVNEIMMFLTMLEESL